MWLWSKVVHYKIQDRLGNEMHNERMVSETLPHYIRYSIPNASMSVRRCLLSEKHLRISSRKEGLSESEYLVRCFMDCSTSIVLLISFFFILTISQQYPRLSCSHGNPWSVCANGANIHPRQLRGSWWHCRTSLALVGFQQAWHGTHKEGHPKWLFVWQWNRV
jgi:hypothetical protein